MQQIREQANPSGFLMTAEGYWVKYIVTIIVMPWGIPKEQNGFRSVMMS
jgi:hypothetical protein